MAAIGQPFTVTVPAVGTSGTAYASSINEILQECIDRLSVAVPSGSIAAATSDLDINNQGLTNIGELVFYAQDAVPAGAPYGRFASYGGNVYWVSADGVVQITANGSVNVAGVAGIGGDYGGSDPALVSFVGADETYEFYDDFAAAQWAALKASDLHLIDEVTGRIISIGVPAAVATSWVLTLPEDAPAAGTALVSLNAGGELATGSTIDTAEAFSGVVTFSADPVLSGTTNIRHGERTVQVGLAATAFGPGPVAVSVVPTTVSGILVAPVDATTINIPLDVHVGWRIISVRATGNKSNADVATIALRHKAAGSSVVIVGSDTSTTTGTYSVDVTGLTHTVLASNKYFVTLVLPKATDTLEMIELIYDVVA